MKITESDTRLAGLITDVTIAPSDDAGREGLLRAMGRYGFTECQSISTFLSQVCGEQLTRLDYVWINGMLRACLQRHDDGHNAAYFMELKYLQMYTEYLLSLEAGT